ncbi:MAG: GNAT family N-acetyltransferase [Pseudomonadota bacterium]
MQRVQLREFRPNHVPLLEAWLSAEHVREWFPEPDDMLEWAQAVPRASRHFIAEADGEAVGYIRWTYVDRATLDAIGFGDLPSHSADIDLLIGAGERTGRGIGPAMLDEALAVMRRDGLAELAAVTTSVRNTHAQRAFEHAGFRLDRQYEPEGFGPCKLMLRSVWFRNPFGACAGKSKP